MQHISRLVKIYLLELVETNANVVCHLRDGVQGEASAIFVPFKESIRL